MTLSFEDHIYLSDEQVGLMSHIHEPTARRLCNILEHYIGWINRIDKIGPDFIGPACPENQVDVEQFTQMRRAAFSRPERILDFIRENPFSLSDDDLVLAEPVSRSIWDKFWIVKSTKKFAIFMNESPNARVYKVIPLSDQGERNLLSVPLPLATELALIPIQGKITYDLLIIIMIKPSTILKKQILSNYNLLKEKYGIISSIT